MPIMDLEITQKAMEDFKKIQEYMLLAKEENSPKTYAKLKKRISLPKKLPEHCRCQPDRH